MALKHTTIDTATFTTVRLLSGALALALLVRVQRLVRQVVPGPKGNWWPACALFVWAADFSFAYISTSAATGALLLLGAVQASMIGYGLFKGEKLRPL